MALLYSATVEELGSERAPNSNCADVAQAPASALSWGAIMTGAAGAAALALILLMLGGGLGLSSVSPWAHYGASAATFGVSTVLWVTLTQVLASAMRGYLAGRLRTRWDATDTDEADGRCTRYRAGMVYPT